MKSKFEVTISFDDEDSCSDSEEIAAWLRESIDLGRIAAVQHCDLGSKFEDTLEVEEVKPLTT